MSCRNRLGLVHGYREWILVWEVDLNFIACVCGESTLINLSLPRNSGNQARLSLSHLRPSHEDIPRAPSTKSESAVSAPHARTPSRPDNLLPYHRKRVPQSFRARNPVHRGWGLRGPARRGAWNRNELDSFPQVYGLFEPIWLQALPQYQKRGQNASRGNQYKPWCRFHSRLGRRSLSSVM